ncbi:MAG: hypothetical protein QNJ41_12045 [Xenococcaceae cyanobacterium MO_188.B32]|nr:hypothetical protein [Xenococcaceae cyanobacterium MO_188.B32]
MFKVPSFAWFVISLSTLIYSTGIAISEFQKSSLAIGIAYLKTQTIAESSKLLKLSKELEEIASELEQKELAYNALTAEYSHLIEHNQPLKMLEPAIQRVGEIERQNKLEALKKEAEQIADIANKNIELVLNENH